MGSVIVFKKPPFSSSSLLSSTSATRCRPLSCRRRCNLRLRTCTTLGRSRICKTSFKSFAASTNLDVDVDVDVDVEHTNKENENSHDLLSISSGCSIPIVHLNSDILGSGSLNLLEENYVDSLLTALPVLSEEEQDALAATPAHPAGLYALYASVLAGNLVEQVWNFAWPAAVALIHQSLLPVAVISFFSKLAIFIGGPLVGSLIDYVPRIPAYNCLSLIQATSQLLSAIMIMYGLTAVRHTSAAALLLQPWFVVLVGAAATERLSGLALGVMVERDWVVLLAGTNREIALAEANAMLNRVDMFCEIAGALLFGFLLSKYDPLTCLKLAAGLITCSLPVLLLLGKLTNKLSLGALARLKFCHGYDESIRICTVNRIENIVENSLDTIRRGFLAYKNQPVLPASIAYVMLSFNIALAPGAMMTTFLTQKGISPSIIGGFSGLCAFMGVAATFLSANLVKKLGILKAGAAGLIFQSSILVLATVVLCGGLLSKNPPLLLFLFLVVLSRLGHMIYDVIGTQILQTGIPASKANLIGATEISIASLAEFFMLGVAIVANDVSHFGFLAMLSVFSVVGATLMFCKWLTNPTAEQRKFFS